MSADQSPRAGDGKTDPSGATYRIETVADMLKVPPERRGVMFRELETTLLTHEFAASLASDTGLEWPALKGLDWTDDGDHAAHVSVNGEPLLSLKVTKKSAASDLQSVECPPDPEWVDQQLAAAPAAPSVPASFPAAIWQLLLTVADRKGTEYTGPWEGPNGEPMQDDADAAIAWIKARSAAPAAAPAGDPLQGAADWLRQALVNCTETDLQQRLLIGFNRAARLMNAQETPQAVPFADGDSPCVLEWGAVSLPVDDPSRVTNLVLCRTLWDAIAEGALCGFDWRVYPLADVANPAAIQAPATGEQP